jgi:hypothetical protein
VSARGDDPAFHFVCKVGDQAQRRPQGAPEEPGADDVSRRVHAYQGPCHDDVEWTCLGCGRIVCGTCEPSPNEPELCDLCFWIEDPGTPGLDGAA